MFKSHRVSVEYEDNNTQKKKIKKNNNKTPKIKKNEKRLKKRNNTFIFMKNKYNY